MADSTALNVTMSRQLNSSMFRRAKTKVSPLNKSKLNTSNSAAQLKSAMADGLRSKVSEQTLQISTMETAIKKYPQSQCAYCMTKQRFMIALPCKHSFCGDCLQSFVSVTKIRKSYSASCLDSEEIMCPTCSQVHLLSAFDGDTSCTQVLHAEDLRRKHKESADKKHA